MSLVPWPFSGLLEKTGGWALPVVVPAGVVFGGNRNTISGGGAIMPVVLYCGYDFFVDAVTQPRNQLRSYHLSLLVNRNFHLYVSFNPGRDVRAGMGGSTLLNSMAGRTSAPVVSP